MGWRIDAGVAALGGATLLFQVLAGSAAAQTDPHGVQMDHCLRGWVNDYIHNPSNNCSFPIPTRTTFTGGLFELQEFRLFAGRLLNPENDQLFWEYMRNLEKGPEGDIGGVLTKEWTVDGSAPLGRPNGYKENFAGTLPDGRLVEMS